MGPDGPRAGLPGVAGCLGVPAKTINFWKRAVFFFSARKRNFFCWCFFPSFGGVFVLLGGVFVFVLFGGIFVLFQFLETLPLLLFLSFCFWLVSLSQSGG